MVLLIIIPMKNGYFIGNINPTFSGPNPIAEQILFRAILHEEQQADLWIYSAAMNACGRGEQWQQSVALLSKMQQDQLDADIIAYSTVISSCAKSGQWEQALMFLGAMQAKHGFSKFSDLPIFTRSV